MNTFELKELHGKTLKISVGLDTGYSDTFCVGGMDGNGKIYIITDGKSSDKQVIEKLQIENEKLEKENKKLRECIEFYAKQENWDNNGRATPITDIGKKDMENFGGNMFFGGKRARKTLNELDKK